MVLQRVLSRAALRFDRAFYERVLRKPPTPGGVSVDRMAHAQRLERLEQVQRSYESARHASDPEAFFPHGEPRDVREQFVRARAGGGAVYDLTWRTGVEPYLPELADRVYSIRNNRLAAARVLTAGPGGGRPVVLQVHGFLGGRYAIEERLMPVRHFLERGVDVALAVLPFHGARADDPLRDPRLFFAGDPRMTIEAFRQAVVDLRGLMTLMLARGATAVGALGMSLGGYSSALLATVDPRLAFVAPFIPLASVPDSAKQMGTYVGSDDEKALQYASYDDALALVSPLRRAPLVRGDRALVIAGEHDAITPMAHARKLAEHFSCGLVTFRGGHLLQLGRSDALRALDGVLERHGLLSREALERADARRPRR